MKKEKVSEGDRKLQGSLNLTGLDQDLLMVRRSREEEGEQLWIIGSHWMDRRCFLRARKGC